jgi:FG-GAP repeat
VKDGNGDGTFQNPADYDGPFGATSVAIGDVNGDGNLDLVVSSRTCYPCRDSVSVLPGKGDGTFQPPVNFYPGGYLRDGLVAVGDVNGDGKPDLVVGNDCSVSEKFGYCPTNGTVGVLVNNFTADTATTLTSSPNPSHVNQSVTFVATVTSSTSVPPNGSTVIFYDPRPCLEKVRQPMA